MPIPFPLRTKKRTVYQGIFVPHPWDVASAIYANLETNQQHAQMFSGPCSQFHGNRVNLNDPGHLMVVFDITPAWKKLNHG